MLSNTVPIDIFCAIDSQMLFHATQNAFHSGVAHRSHNINAFIE